MTFILLSGMAGIAIPLIEKHHHFLRSDSNLFVAAKAFAAGVILATSFIHMLSNVSEVLNHPCLPSYLYSKSSKPRIIEWNGGKVFGEEESGGMHIVRMHAHVVHHKHNHPHGNYACHGISGLKEQGHAHAHVDIEEGEEEIDVRHVVVSQGLHLEVASRKPNLRPHQLQ
ncbi:hypothetical protein VNO77_02227 [Canavalia gladiata]|uniref:Uncharacterized protein n=1 Tax=Canavalia gladiata TaxID=3824 RepID=A0AAN9R717_CANGL